jgi:3-phosphoshikimate 1-carboxyvinyltransferase
MNTEIAAPTVTVPGSKSVINRLLILASMQCGAVTLCGGSRCADVQAMLSALRTLGLDALGAETVVVHSSGKLASGMVVFLQDAGTAGRFLLARVAAQPGCRCRFIFSVQLLRRPFLPLIAVLQKMGACIEPTDDGFEVTGAHLSGGDVQLDATVSSQFVSALLMIAPLCQEPLQLHLQGTPVSRPYIDMTIALMRRCGIEIVSRKLGYYVCSGQSYQLLPMISVEPDYSSACYFWALGAIGHTAVSITHSATTAPTCSLQPDARFTSILCKMGAQVEHDAESTTVYPSQLRGVEVSMSDMPDQVPTLAVLALFAASPTRILDVHHLVHKESNRIEALITELGRLGAKIEYRDCVLQVWPFHQKAQCVQLKTYNDHRMAMALGLLLVRYPHLTLDAPECVSKSYPEYWQEMRRIGLFLDTKKTESK